MLLIKVGAVPVRISGVLRIGLSGGIGSGKSTVAGRFGELGATVIDADQLAREVVEPGHPGLRAVIEAFGPQVLAADGTLDRPALGAIVFADDQERQRLNGILHPLIAARTEQLMAQVLARAGPGAVVVHDVPLLVENGLASRYQLVVIVHASAQLRVQRLIEARGMTADDAWQRVNAQASDEERRAVADVWIDNSGSRQSSMAVVDDCWQDRVQPLRGLTS